MKKILVATDLSERSDRAMVRAFALAAKLNAELTVVSVVDDSLPDDMAQRLVSDVNQRLTATCEKLSASSPARFVITVVCGDPTSEVLSKAADLQPDLTVLGLHRRRVFFDKLRETTLERLVRTAANPILLVAQPSNGHYQNVLLPVDFSPSATGAAIAAVKLAPSARLTTYSAIHIPFHGMLSGGTDQTLSTAFFNESEQASKIWMANSALPDTVPTPELIEGGLHQVLDQKVASEKPDLIAIGAHGKSSTARWTLGSFASDLVRNPPCDLLVARPPLG